MLARRSVGTTVVLDDCHDPHNATAVLRTCEAFGLAEIHVVPRNSPFRVNKKISQGAHLYTDVVSHDTISDCYAVLRSKGYKIIASSLQAGSVVDPHDLAIPGEATALVFGNEESGVSDQGKEEADATFYVPLSGLTQSLNLSVTVAVTLFSIRHQSLAADDPGDMPEARQEATYERWIRRQLNSETPTADGNDS